MLTSHPGKGLWTTFAVLYTLLRLPLLSVLYLVPFFRPCPQWTFRQALMNNLMRAFLYHTAVVEAVTSLRLEPGSEGDRFAQIPVADNKYYQGVLDDSRIKPVPTGGTWYPAKPAGSDGQVILHLHGGGYAIGEGRPGDAAYAATVLTKHVAPHALFLSYRLASNKDGRFPAALQDTVSAYVFLISLGFHPSQIIISGDSAGGHVAISFLRYIASNSGILSSPQAALLWSPAVDLISARSPDSVRTSRRYNTDYLAGNFVVWGAKKFSADLDATRAEIKPYLQPRNHAFVSRIPVWISVGAMEIFHDDNEQFAKNMRAMKGNEVELYVIPRAPHDVMFVGNIMGWEPEAESAAKAAKEFLDRN